MSLFVVLREQDRATQLDTVQTATGRRRPIAAEFEDARTRPRILEFCSGLRRESRGTYARRGVARLIIQSARSASSRTKGFFKAHPENAIKLCGNYPITFSVCSGTLGARGDETAQGECRCKGSCQGPISPRHRKHFSRRGDSARRRRHLHQ